MKSKDLTESKVIEQFKPVHAVLNIVDALLKEGFDRALIVRKVNHMIKQGFIKGISQCQLTPKGLLFGINSGAIAVVPLEQ